MIDLLGVLGGALFIGFVVWKFGSPGHGLGLFHPDVHCPSCDEIAPRHRHARNFRQMMLGGWTCRKCGCEFNGFGKKL